MVAMSIFAVMSVMILTVYFNMTNTSRRLAATRELSETAREITERVAREVYDYGISLSGSRYSESTFSYDGWANPDMTGSGGEMFALGTDDAPVVAYFYATSSGTMSDGQIKPCVGELKSDSTTHCGLYRIPRQGTGWDWQNRVNMVDTFIPEEEKKRVKMTDFAVYISGGDFTQKKIMIRFSLSLMPRI
jgi:type II secretory pathway pseudopilin PulG